MNRTLMIVMSAAALAACGDRAQTQDASVRKIDTPAWSNSSEANPAYAASGWKSGDKTAWESQLRKRSEAQDEYKR